MKYTCKHCLNTQYIPQKLIQNFVRMLCYVCNNVIPKQEK